MFTEEILYKKSRTGTTAFYFVPNKTPEQIPLLEEPAYLVFNNFNQPIYFANYSGKEIWSLENTNGYQLNTLLSSVTTNYVTGYSFSQTLNKVLSNDEKDSIRQRFNDNVVTTLTAQTNIPIGYTTYVFFNEKLVDDMFANIKLNRSYETLDTLNIYNTPINSIPQQEARTGVLFGKLEAIQLIKNDEGNAIRIPLANVPIGIFTPSEEFPTPSSLDDNGDRFYMNLKETSGPNIYFSPSYTSSSLVPIAYEEDQKFLKSNSELLSLPEKFKFITITNENGEFVIYNAPIGNNIVVFEVDLFKQGLSKDEIILNNFPFPQNDNSNIGEFPCYYYNQVPVDVVPAWGTSQTGYTELNISVNLDLRKWSTYIFAPGAYGNEKLETTTAKNAANTLKIQIRDMTSPGFIEKPLEVAQIDDDLDRDTGSQYQWFNEFNSKRSQLQYNKFGCHVLKLPANLYDPSGFRTDTNGVPTSQKGVWLSAYQFRVFVNTLRGYRDTGADKKGVNKMHSHFGISYSQSNTSFGDLSALGVYPYEKPWSITYPEPYNIPAKPTKQRILYRPDRTYGKQYDESAGPLIVEEPAYFDGDLLGNVYNNTSPQTNVGGFGIQSDITENVYFPNRIAFVATNTYMYKYERGVSWQERYANGYQPYWTGPSGTGYGPWVTNANESYPALAGMSSVVNGEKYQRVEAGYGYFMIYNDWNINYRWPWATDWYWQRNSSPTITPNGLHQVKGANTKSLLPHPCITWNLDNQDYALAFDVQEGVLPRLDGINIYRIVNSGPAEISVPKNFVVPTGARLSFGGHADRLYSFYMVNTGAIDVKLTNKYNVAVVYVENPSGGSIAFPVDSSFTLNPGGLFKLPPNGNTQPAFEFTEWYFPGNDNFNSNTNRYDTCSYQLGVSICCGAIDGNGNIPSSGFLTMDFSTYGVSANISPTTWYLNASNTGTKDDSTPDRHGVSSWGLQSKNHSIYSLYIETSPR